MRVYRITLTRWADQLVASGNPARWNSTGKYVIYTAANRALACLENVVHRSGEGLREQFRVMVIEIPDRIKTLEIKEKDLPKQWTSFENYSICQNLGDAWLEEMKTVVLKIPSAIIPNEHNYLINPNHPGFKKVKLLSREEFIFDHRLSHRK